jgi:cell division protein FtsN
VYFILIFFAKTKTNTSMSRLDYLTIAIVALCMAALIYLVYRYVNLPHEPHNLPNTEKIVRDTTQYTDETAGYPAEDTSSFDRPSPGAAVDTETIEKPALNTVTKKATVKPAPVEPKPTPSPVETETIAPAPTAATSSGKYMVIAGSFKNAGSAQTQLKQVKKLGYANARIEKFNRGAYATVLVDRFANSGSAKSLVNTLKSKGIDAMVLEKR